jgi:phosphoglycerate dehydrogenase-like enzyme
MPKPDNVRISRPSAVFHLKQGYWRALYGEQLTAEIAERVALLARPERLDERPSAPDALRDAEILFAGWSTPVIDERFLEAAPNLRAVFYAGGSVRPFATEALWNRGIRVTAAYA